MIDIDSYLKFNTERSCKSILSHDEMKTSNRLLITKKRNQYISSCSVLRQILSYYLNSDPGALDFKYSPAGKPTLSGVHRGRLSFNISHSHGKMLLGITASDEIGIDIEKVNHSRLINKIASRKFTPSERNLLKICNPEDSAQRFCRLWTRKEAVLKAAGTGLLFPMRNIDVSDIQSGHSVFIEPIPQKFEIITQSDWYFYDIESFEGFCAAVSMNFIPESINILSVPPDYCFPA
ncbi:4'-phosphopantetheinyl transferase family protein [Candidatus Latescibacterota bacterium]